MKYLTAAFLLVLSTLYLYGQSDDAAIKILDTFSDIASKAPSVFIEFETVTSDIMEKSSDTVAGTVMLKKDSYRLDLPDNIIWYDGKTSWSLLVDEQEITITEPEKDDNSFLSHPSLVYTMYKKNYKCRLLEENKSSYIIDLYPEDLKTDIIRIRLYIDKNYRLSGMEYKRKDGITININVKTYNLTIKPDPRSFSFNAGKYRDFDIIDMR